MSLRSIDRRKVASRLLRLTTSCDETVSVRHHASQSESVSEGRVVSVTTVKHRKTRCRRLSPSVVRQRLSTHRRCFTACYHRRGGDETTVSMIHGCRTHGSGLPADINCRLIRRTIDLRRPGLSLPDCPSNIAQNISRHTELTTRYTTPVLWLIVQEDLSRNFFSSRPTIIKPTTCLITFFQRRDKLCSRMQQSH